MASTPVHVLVAAAVEAVGDAEERGEARAPGRRASASSSGNSSLTRGSPRRCQRTMAASSSISSGAKPAELTVAHEVRAVLVVAAAGDVLADVVQQRGELEQLAVGVAEAVHAARCRRTGRARASRPGGRGARPSCSAGPGRATALRRIACGSSDQSAGSWRPTASSTMPSRSAHSLMVSWSRSNSSIAVASTIDAGDDEVDAAGVEALDAEAIGAPVDASSSLCSVEELADA